MTRRDAEPQRLDEVLDVAATLFHVKGYSATSLADIGNELGIHKASLYHYVRSKEDLLQRVVFRASSQLRKMATDPEVDRRSPRDALEGLVRGHCAVLLAHPHEFAVLIDQRRHVEPDVIGQISERERDYVAAVRRVVERGISDGSFRGIDAGIATHLVMEAANSVLHWYKPTGRLEQAEVIDELWSFVEHGLVAVEAA